MSNEKDLNTNNKDVNKGFKGFYFKHKDLLWEIFRFLLVGGLATIVDWAICFVANLLIPEIKFGNWSFNNAIAVTLGFIAGLIVNYVLSIVFVYKNKKNKDAGKSGKDFVVFTLIGVFTLGLSYLGIFIMSDLWHWPFMIARVIMTAIGLVLNYLGRKILIFK